MSKAIIWHNPRCSKSRGALKLLRERGIEVEERRYLDDPPTPEELDAALKQLALAPEQIVRTGEALYRELGLKDRPLSRDEWLQVLSENPRLIERPIVFYNGRAVIGRPPERVLELL
ncbi:arsenate reductase (glutaredoxin) [Sulfurivirga sp.]|uniref:arsenate reductase (glutaredoxin) n=1 Tax=Sulfurivirga sp. TaxID=2614236 RepID=UPI0025DC125B|nr:arsenate reductase (glutaredoxin) [Sulfurivirga sp.]